MNVSMSFLKICPSTPTAKHFVDIDTSKYEIDHGLFESRKEIKCKEKISAKKNFASATG
uniref:Uncharacterized protein n=1 Tax=Meloidogyne enterolobii TaxID=390850 RepID=A0A6V7UMD1_MELEN|nr:unnamed protein product [Meloidogyne enterolobii]